MSIQYQDPLQGEAFDEVNNLLDDGNSETDVLMFKNAELQKIVQTLTRTNEKLIGRIKELEEEMEQERQGREEHGFNEEYSVLQIDFGDVEDMIREYKRELEGYQGTVSGQLQEKNRIIVELQGRNDQLIKENEVNRQQISQLQLENEMLQNTREGLLSQIDDLESSLRKSKHETSKFNSPSHRYQDVIDMPSRYEGEGYGVGGDFGMSVQYQLEKLIEKLVKELEHERYMKKKLVEEIKQLRRDVLEQEKQIIEKNNKIYELQISAVRSHKIGGNEVRGKFGRFRAERQREERRGHRENMVSSPVATSSDRDRGNTASRRKNFTMMQLMNECTLLSIKQKLIISLKLIDLYSKKYQNEDYSSEILESLLVTNYNQNNAHLCQIKINPAVQKEQEGEDENEQQLVWNLVFILDSLLMQMGSRDRDMGENQSEQTVLEAIGFFLENREENSIESVMELRKIVEEALHDHLR